MNFFIKYIFSCVPDIRQIHNQMTNTFDDRQFSSETELISFDVGILHSLIQ